MLAAHRARPGNGPPSRVKLGHMLGMHAVGCLVHLRGLEWSAGRGRTQGKVGGGERGCLFPLKKKN